MNELIQIQVKDDQQLVSARELHNKLASKKKFSAWWIQSTSRFIEDEDYTRAPQSYLVKSGNGTVRYYDDYLLTIDTAKMICMMTQTRKGDEVRRYFIEVERKWNDPQEVVRRGYAILQNENLQLKVENHNLTLQLEETTKKASYLDVILGTTDRLATTQIAMDYGFSTIAFNRLLHEVGIQHQVNHQWILYKAFMGKNYTVTRVYTYKDAKGQTHAKPLTCWTQKGRKLIYDILKERDYLPLIERGDIR